MLKEIDNRNSVMTHSCGPFCLGPLTFHRQVVGNKIRLSQGCRLAERTGNTFKNGLVFSSRPVRIREKVRLKVVKDISRWHGALRVGFTNIPPSDRSLPLPCMAIPNLTERPGHWAAPVDEYLCTAGSELKFWVSKGGTVYITTNNHTHKLIVGLDLSKPLWAMIDIYGQTSSVFLLGSEKRFRTSCPGPTYITPPDDDNIYVSNGDFSSFNENTTKCISLPQKEQTACKCVVCMENEATFTLVCGHQCLCTSCSPKVLQCFDTCPLCRRSIIGS